MITTCVSLAVVAHGKQCDTGIPAIAQRFGDRGQRISRAEHLAANQMRCDIAISEAEPVRLRAVRGEFFFRIPGFAGVPPSAFGCRYRRRVCTYKCPDRGRMRRPCIHTVVPDVDDGRDAMWAFVFLEGFTTGDSERVLNYLEGNGPRRRRQPIQSRSRQQSLGGRRVVVSGGQKVPSIEGRNTNGFISFSLTATRWTCVISNVSFQPLLVSSLAAGPVSNTVSNGRRGGVEDGVKILRYYR